MRTTFVHKVVAFGEKFFAFGLGGREDLHRLLGSFLVRGEAGRWSIFDGGENGVSQVGYWSGRHGVDVKIGLGSGMGGG